LIRLPTYRYKGQGFETEFAARWQAFFDHLEIPCAYRLVTVPITKGGYIPDFYLPETNGGLFVEVKARPFSPTELLVRKELADYTGNNVLLMQEGFFGTYQQQGNYSRFVMGSRAKVRQNFSLFENLGDLFDNSRFRFLPNRNNNPIWSASSNAIKAAFETAKNVEFPAE